MSRTVRTPDVTRHAERDPESAATTAAYKINAVLIFLRALEDHADTANPDRIDDGGWGIYVVTDLLRGISEDLLTTVSEADAARTT